MEYPSFLSDEVSFLARLTFLAFVFALDIHVKNLQPYSIFVSNYLKNPEMRPISRVRTKEAIPFENFNFEISNSSKYG